MYFLNALMDYIERNVVLGAPLLPGMLDSDPVAIAIRPTPSSMNARYLDKGKVQEYSFQVLIKHPNNMQALEKLYEITNLLDGLSNGAITSTAGSFLFVKCEVYTLPNFVETTDRGEFIYTALFTAELEGGI